MLIRCWGSRGGLPVSGEEFLKFGGDTTCMEVRAGSGELIIIDAGSGIRSLNGLKDDKKTPVHLLFTHAHMDHIIGFPFFTPLYDETRSIKIYGYPGAVGGIKETLSQMMRDPFFPADISTLPASITYVDLKNKPFNIGSALITPINLNHTNIGLGFRIEENGKSFVFLTDNELSYSHPDGKSFEDYAEFCKDADLLIHDAEFNETEYQRFKGWGHSNVTDTLKLAQNSNVTRLGLFHVNSKRTDEQMDLFVKDARQKLLEAGSKIECFGVGCGFEIELG